MSETATLSSKFQISIPKAIRAAQHWEAGLTLPSSPRAPAFFWCRSRSGRR